MKGPIRTVICLLVAVNVCAAIFISEDAVKPKKKKDVSETLDWVDEQDLYDYNARDGSLWSDLLEQWTVRNESSVGQAHNGREGRVLQANRRYIPTSGFLITKRMGEAASELEPHMRPPGGKVISQFRPSQPYGVPQSNQQFQQLQQQQQQQQNGPREVSETDLYLLGAIEKLVFRVDYLEQRLRKTEQMLYYLMQGNNVKDESYCPQNFTQVSKKCYHFGAAREVNWQSANNLCKGMGAHLAEFEEKIELKQMTKYLLAQSPHKGKDFWLGGLNPGLLWIWSNSARPINANTNLTLAAAQAKSDNDDSTVQKVKREDPASSKQINESASTPTYDEIKGTGRCLRLSYNVKKARYQYTGHDCSARQLYLCEFEDRKVENEIDRVSKSIGKEDEGVPST